VIDESGEDLPEFQAPGRRGVDLHARHGHELRRLGLRAFAPRVDPHLLHALDGVGHVTLHHDATNHEAVVVHRPVQDVIAIAGHLSGVVRRQHQVLAALVTVGAGQADIGEIALPVVVDEADQGTRRNVDHDRPGLGEVDGCHRVDGGVVRGEPDGSGVEEVIGDGQFVQVGADVSLRGSLDRFERHHRIGPHVRLHGALEVDLVKELPCRLGGRIAPLVLQCAKASLHLGRNRATRVLHTRHDDYPSKALADAITVALEPVVVTQIT
jgi:hypothetical protein